MILSLNRNLNLLFFYLKGFFNLFIQMMSFFVVLCNRIVAVIHIDILKEKYLLSHCYIASVLLRQIFKIQSLCFIVFLFSGPLGNKTHDFLANTWAPFLKLDIHVSFIENLLKVILEPNKRIVLGLNSCKKIIRLSVSDLLKAENPPHKFLNFFIEKKLWSVESKIVKEKSNWLRLNDFSLIFTK